MSSKQPTSLQQSITQLKGVGEQTAEKFKKLGIESVQDLLFHLPLRYQDRTRIYPISDLKTGQEILIEGEVMHRDVIVRKRRMLLVQLEDDTGRITLRFFYFSNPDKMGLARGAKIRCFGEIRQGPQSFEMVHPEYKVLGDVLPPLDDSLTPTYPATEGMQQRTLRKYVGMALDIATNSAITELLPQSLRDEYKLSDLQAALSIIHHPTPDVPVHELVNGTHSAQKRLIFEEMMAHHISLRRLRENDKQQTGLAMGEQETYVKRLLAKLPFELTQAQQRVIAEIRADMQAHYPMNRLVQGDVGSGKTLVAAAAALYAIESGYQVALMAPTEILAEQHYHNFTQWFEPLGIEVSWLSGKLTKRAKRSEVENLLLDITKIAVGTHALFQDDVKFNQLGLIIVDEQHRFGVDQRLALREKGKQGHYYPHQLIMTATPIPRTLAMTACADLDYSVIDELPPGRQPINTVAISNSRRDDIIQRIESVCEEGRQVYWVCTLIEESEVLQCQAAEDTLEYLRETLPDLNIGLVHGRMNYGEKETTMAEFKVGELDLLVATTVIEVGVDVPNATLMIIENSERLGLAQLHQLRGRVGRGKHASHCVLLYQTPLSKIAHKRLNALRNSSDGFEIAGIDLEIRGPGEVFGTRQTGELRFRIADLSRDEGMLPTVQSAAQSLIDHHSEAADALVKRWIHRGDEYASV